MVQRDDNQTVSDFSDTESQGPPPTHLYTCLACHIAFKTADAQRRHYQSDWHRYNLKRKVAELTPVSEELFHSRMKVQQEKAQEELEKKDTVSWVECVPCGKKYTSENAYQNHIQSKKHKETVLDYEKKKLDVDDRSLKQVSKISKSQISTWKQQVQQASTQEEIQALIEEKFATAMKLEKNQCLFCTHTSPSFDLNMEHMTHSHSFFIPDIEFLVDLEGLMDYLAEKVAVTHVCLYCNGKGRAFHSLESVRKHMVDKGHCKILYTDETVDEFAPFYDFSDVYASDEEEEEEWEDVGESIHKEQEESDSMMVKSGRPVLPCSTVTDDATQMILPSGRKAGHRAYNKYWKQSFKAEESRDALLIHRLIGHYQHMGMVSTYQRPGQLTKEEIVKRRVQSKEQLSRYHDYRSRVGIKANSLQTYFRIQNPL